MPALPWIAVVLMAAPAFAQKPPGVTFILGSRDGRTSFRRGETISLEFQFRANAPGEYRIDPSAGKRVTRMARFDQFAAEPKANTRDPLRDIPAWQELGGFSGYGGPVSLPLTDRAVTVGRDLNEWISLRKPGHYRITAETTRVTPIAQPAAALTLHSNPLEIEVTAAEPGWAAAQLKSAVAALELGDQPAAIGQPFDTVRERHVEQSARVLRFLETPEAARALVRFFESGPQVAQQDLRAGLFASPYRAEVLSAMEAGFDDPRRPITRYWIGTLIELAAATSLPLPLPFSASHPEAERARLALYKPFETRYFAKLADSIGRKEGQARAVSLETLIFRGPQPAPAALLTALIQNFQDLPPGEQHMLLGSEWPRIGSPALEPLLRSVAQGKSPARDMALLRLFEFQPALARQIALDRLRRGDISVEGGGHARVLMSLPEQTLPDLENSLVSALERGEPAQALVARYASEAVFGRVQAWLERQPGALCGGPLAAYFFRVDPAYATALFAKQRFPAGGGCALFMAPYEDLLMSPGLERAAINDLSSPNPTIVRAAQTLLQYGGSPSAEQPLWDALEGLKSKPVGPIDSGLEFGFTEALLKANGWILTPEKIDRLAAACPTAIGRSFVASERRALQEPIRISLFTAGPFEGTLVGPFLLRSQRQFAAKIGQFPRGARFRFESVYPGTWWGDKRSNEIRQALTLAGMLLEEPTPRAATRISMR